MKKIIHHISLKNIGGMQDAFVSYYNQLNNKEKKNLEVYGNYPLENKFYSVKNYFHLSLNIFLWIKFLKKLRDKNTTVVLHGLLTSKKFNFLLKIFRSNNLIFYEHGAVWNVDRKHSDVIKSNSIFSSIIIANSLATKMMLEKKFRINPKKIRVTYYGFKKIKKSFIKKNKKNFTVGFIGRFDSHKGIHILLKAFEKISQKNILLKIAGDGDLFNTFFTKYKNYKNIEFVGRITNVYSFFNSIDSLVVPSIREPLGIVIIQAGLAKVPVIASWVDGIPEVLKKNCGILIKPTKKLNNNIFNSSKIKKPELIIDCNKKLSTPKEVDHIMLKKKIYFLKKNQKLSKDYANNLNKYVIKNFSENRYYRNLNKIINEKN